MANDLTDAAARHRAATCFDANLVVSAAAGTGKTSLLVERILNAVGSGRFRLEEMAAVTFTRKAAAEMRDRLSIAFERLRELAEGGESAAGERVGGGRDGGGKSEAPAARSFAWLSGEAAVSRQEIAGRSLAALGSLERFSVATIHSFCAEILRMHPVEAGVDPDFHQDEGTRFESVFDREWRRFLEEELGPGAGRVELWERALAVFSLAELRLAARALADFDSPDPGEWRAGGEEARAVLASLLRPLADEAGRLLQRAAGARPRFRAFLAAVRQLAEAFLDGSWPGGGSPPPAGLEFDIFKASGVPAIGSRAAAVEPQEAESLYKRARNTLRALLQLSEVEIAALLEPLAPFVPRFREAYLKEGFVSFDGLLALSRDLLRDHPGARRSLQRRYRHLLVDEFQDTSPLQYEILFLLAAAGGADAERNAWQVPLSPGRLFIVGDAKQSIYRFLKADMAAYRRAVERIVAAGGEVLHLTANFRSAPSIIAPLNQLFEARFPRADGAWQPSYQPMEAAGTVDEAAQVEVWSTGATPRRADDRRLAEARAIAAWMVEHAGEGREFRASQVAILFRASTHTGVYLEELRRCGVPLVVEGGRGFLERPEVRHLRALLLCLARPHDAVALAAVLRSPVGGVSDPELALMARPGVRPGWSWLEAEREGLPPAAGRCLAWLRDLARGLRDLPADEQALEVLERSRLELIEAAHPDGAQAVANLRRYAGAVAERARQEGMSLEQAVGAVDAAAGDARSGVEESPLADETLEAVRVLTVHKAKGMEFDAVIVADLCRDEASVRGEEVEVGWMRGEAGGAAVRTRQGVNARRILFEHEEELHEEAEALRALYVACTRARRRLILVAGPARSKVADLPWPAALAEWGYDAQQPPADGPLPVSGGRPGSSGGRTGEGRVLHRDVSGLGPAPAAAGAAAPSCEEQVARHQSVVSAARSEAGNRDMTPSGLSESLRERRHRVSAASQASPGRGGAALGRIMHRALERWDGNGDGAAALQEAIRRVAAEAAEPAPSLSREAAILWGAVQSSTLPALLRGGATLGREIPILMEDNGVVWHGTIDLLYRGGGDEWVVLDYKTEEPGAAAAARARDFLPQIRVYARAVQSAVGCLPRAEIFWVRTGERTVFAPEDLAGPLS